MKEGKREREGKSEGRSVGFSSYICLLVLECLNIQPSLLTSLFLLVLSCRVVFGSSLRSSVSLLLLRLGLQRERERSRKSVLLQRSQMPFCAESEREKKKKTFFSVSVSVYVIRWRHFFSLAGKKKESG